MRYNSDYCQDVVGNWGNPNDFISERVRVNGSLVNVRREGRDWYYIEDGTPSDLSQYHAPYLDLPEPNNLVLSVIARSGPLTPKVHLGTAAFELREIPGMLRHAGDLLLKLRRPWRIENPLYEAASANLAYKFGWEPLVSDLMKLANFATLTNKRLSELQKASTSGGLQRRVKLDSQKHPIMSQPSIWSGPTFRPIVSGFQIREIWGTVQWHTNDMSAGAPVPSFEDALRSVYGLNAGSVPASIWKALPWTWMTDWCINVSDMLTRSHNMLYYTPSNLCIMKYYRTIVKHENTKSEASPDDLLSKGEVLCELKTRRAVPSSEHMDASLRLPFLDSFKLSVLGSLAVVKLTRR